MAQFYFDLPNELFQIVFLYIGPTSTVSFSVTSMKAALVAPFEGGRFTQNYIDALVRNLHAKFRRSRYFCKCGSNIHFLYCPLAPDIYCTRRWPGCDGYISLEEYEFLSRLKKKRPRWFVFALRRRRK